MSTFNEADHPRAGDGKFTDKPQSAPEVGLVVDPAAAAAAGDVIAIHFAANEAAQRRQELRAQRTVLAASALIHDLADRPEDVARVAIAIEFDGYSAGSEERVIYLLDGEGELIEDAFSSDPAAADELDGIVRGGFTSRGDLLAAAAEGTLGHEASTWFIDVIPEDKIAEETERLDAEERKFAHDTLNRALKEAGIDGGERPHETLYATLGIPESERERVGTLIAALIR